MQMTIELLKAIGWPIVALFIALVAAFGGFKKPIETLATALGGLLSDVKTLKEELSSIHKSLERTSKEIPEQLKSAKDSVADLEAELKSRLEKISGELTDTRRTLLSDAVNEEIDETFGDESEVERLNKSEPPLDEEAANSAIEDVTRSWRDVVSLIEERFDAAKDFDKREFGNKILELAESKSKTRPTLEQAKEISSLHRRFKGYTRRKSYASDWLTQSLRDKYIADAEKVLGELKT